MPTEVSVCVLRIKQMVNAIANNLIRWRWLLMLATLAIVVALMSGVRFVQFAADYEYWFSKDNPQLADFLEIQNTYDKSDNVIFLLTPSNGRVFTRKTLGDIEWLTKQAWQIPYSTRVDSLSNFQYTHAQGDDLTVADLVKEAASLSDADLQRIRRIAMKEPLLLNRAISKDARVAAVNVTLNMPKDTPQGSPMVTAHARDLVEQLKLRDPDLEVHLSGIIVMDNAFIETSQHDMGTLTLIMFALVLVGLMVFLRSVTGTFSTLIIIVMSILATMGASGWLGVKLTPVTANAPIIILTVTVANAVHILVSFVQAMRGGMRKRAAMVESLRVNLQPVLLATITTAIRFLSMNFSDVPPFQDLGNMVAIGVLIAFLTSIAFLPGLVLLLPVRVRAAKKYNDRHLQGLSRFVIQRRTPLLWAFTGLALLSIVFITNNQIDEEVWKYFDKTVAFRVDTDYASAHLSGPYYMEYSLKSHTPGDVSNPAFLAQVESFQRWLYLQPEVVHVNAITDIMKRLNKNMHGDEESWYRLPDNTALAAQYLLLYEMSLPYGLDLNNQINVDKSATRVAVALHNQSTRNMIAFEQRAETWLSRNLPTIAVTAGSPQYMFSHIGQRTVRKMALGVSFALVLISLSLMIALRSFKTGLISLVPNLIPPAITFGIWGILVGKIGFTHAVAVGMTIGIIVDDTVHFLSKYTRARREKGFTPEEAVQYAFSNVGVALTITTVVLVAGFLVLTLSTFKLNFDLGVITALTIAIALVLDFLLLPALLLTFDNKQPASAAAPQLETVSDRVS